MKYFIRTFGCQQNIADSEKIEAAMLSQKMLPAHSIKDADYIVINTCMVRQSAEARIYGLVKNLAEYKKKKNIKIIITGCMVGLAAKSKTSKFFHEIRKRMPEVDEFIPMEKICLNQKFAPRHDKINAFVTISNGCNNFCAFCIVPLARGREISRPYEDIIQECRELKEKGVKKITLLGQNVNSYGADLVSEKRKKQTADGSKLKPVYVKHLGKLRIPTLFPHLIRDIANIGFEKIDFMSANPWDFSDELIDVIAGHPNITRMIHLPVQSGDDNILRKMNRWYTAKEYINLIKKIKKKVRGVVFTTDIIVGFCGETEKEFQNTVSLCKIIGFKKAYISMYSPRPETMATKLLKDSIPYKIKKQRWQCLDALINKPNQITSQ